MNPTAIILTIDRVSADHSWKATREMVLSILNKYNLYSNSETRQADWAKGQAVKKHDRNLGRSTKKTRGLFSGLSSAHIRTPDGQGGISNIVTHEYTVTGASGMLFSDPGDSGALVFDDTANCIGLIFVGNKYTRASYITLLPDLFNGIKIITGAVNVRIAE
ncbi:hypothetical protein MGYG_06825 [Nannizzia gypsea CBS 118893]|uniref:Peptidase S7 domain-containing protein n=1 Tax=Arthroderma gypseum (strain ATCC MYA-4604 / CBS 118893) TaxID=535722 RepID=E4V1B1_ARTGP|nr:hypothetical protein MGYG_06825 [Nannizzia gypsea CBS 118893]EFR03826.1 hypothetical protein MGYG_06825 [Nannizzia gypsea CBS 118893]